MTPEQGRRLAQRMADEGELSRELQRRAMGYGSPFRDILMKAADLVSSPIITVDP